MSNQSLQIRNLHASCQFILLLKRFQCRVTLQWSFACKVTCWLSRWSKWLLIKGCNSFWRLTFGQIRNLAMTWGNEISNFLILDVLCWFFFTNSSWFHRLTWFRVRTPMLHCQIRLIQEAWLRVYYVEYGQWYSDRADSYFWYQAIVRYNQYRKSGYIVRVWEGFIEQQDKWSISTVQYWSWCLFWIKSKFILGKWFNL